MLRYVLERSPVKFLNGLIVVCSMGYLYREIIIPSLGVNPSIWWAYAGIIVLSLWLKYLANMTTKYMMIWFLSTCLAMEVLIFFVPDLWMLRVLLFYSLSMQFLYKSDLTIERKFIIGSISLGLGAAIIFIIAGDQFWSKYYVAICFMIINPMFYKAFSDLKK